jgi:hypothetical protein
MWNSIIGDQIRVTRGTRFDALRLEVGATELIEPAKFASDMLIHVLPEDPPMTPLRQAGLNGAGSTDDGGIDMPAIPASGAVPIPVPRREESAAATIMIQNA